MLGKIFVCTAENSVTRFVAATSSRGTTALTDVAILGVNVQIGVAAL